MTNKIVPREEPINNVAAADIWEGKQCMGVLIMCGSGVEKISEGGMYPADICRYDSLEEIREQDTKLLGYSED